jgi:hypothetical protein
MNAGNRLSSGTRSYRSGQTILDAAYRLIQHNNPERLEVREGIVKRLHSMVARPGEVEQHRYDTIAAEAEAVAARILELRAGGCALRDIAILVRSNRDAAPFLAALTAARVPHEFSGSRGLFQRDEVRLCVSFLAAVTRPADSQSLFALAASDVYRMPMADLVQLADLARLRLARSTGCSARSRCRRLSRPRSARAAAAAGGEDLASRSRRPHRSARGAGGGRRLSNDLALHRGLPAPDRGRALYQFPAATWPIKPKRRSRRRRRSETSPASSTRSPATKLRSPTGRTPSSITSTS